jgi:hypothetical protein
MKSYSLIFVFLLTCIACSPIKNSTEAPKDPSRGRLSEDSLIKENKEVSYKTRHGRTGMLRSNLQKE